MAVWAVAVVAVAAFSTATSFSPTVLVSHTPVIDHADGGHAEIVEVAMILRACRKGRATIVRSYWGVVCGFAKLRTRRTGFFRRLPFVVDNPGSGCPVPGEVVVARFEGRRHRNAPSLQLWIPSEP